MKKFIIFLGILAVVLISYNFIKIEKVDEYGQLITDESQNIDITSVEQITSTEIQIGSGDEAASGMKVKVHYVGTLEDGTQFDSSREKNTPLELTIGKGDVIAGFDQGILGMKVGGIRKVVIPPSLGYGNEQMGNIPANSTLTFEIELLELVK